MRAERQPVSGTGGLWAPGGLKPLGSIAVPGSVSARRVRARVFAARDARTFGVWKWITAPWFVNIVTSSSRRYCLPLTSRRPEVHDPLRQPFPAPPSFGGQLLPQQGACASPGSRYFLSSRWSRNGTLRRDWGWRSGALPHTR